MSNCLRKCLPFCFLVLLSSATGGCAVFAVGSAAVSVASVGVKTAAGVGGLAVDGASAAARVGSNALKSDPPAEQKE